MIKMMLEETKRAYLAGFFDGDGCVYVGKQLQIVFAQANYEYLKRWRDMLNLGSIHANPRSDNSTKTLWTWRLCDRKAEAVLRLMLPYLEIKRDQAELALAFMELRRHGATRNGVPPFVRERMRSIAKALKSLKRNEDIPGPVRQFHEAINSQLELPFG